MYCILFNFVRNKEASIPYIVNCSNCLFFSILTLGNKIKGENKQTKSLDEPSSVFQVTLTAPVKAFFFFRRVSKSESSFKYSRWKSVIVEL